VIGDPLAVYQVSEIGRLQGDQAGEKAHSKQKVHSFHYGAMYRRKTTVSSV
jgi:hypothetical protein